jgi:hypothetical protein
MSLRKRNRNEKAIAAAKMRLKSANCPRNSEMDPIESGDSLQYAGMFQSRRDEQAGHSG